MQTKVCSRCKKELPLERFGKNKPTNDGLRYECKACNAERARQRRAANPEKHRERNRKWNQANSEKRREKSRQWRAANPEKAREQRWRKQSIFLNGQPLTYSDYQQMLEEQGYKCCICGELHSDKKPLHVDHNHDNGEVRGLLCGNCNKAIGFLADSFSLAEAARDYLFRHTFKVIKGGKDGQL